MAIRTLNSGQVHATAQLRKILLWRA